MKAVLLCLRKTDDRHFEHFDGVKLAILCLYLMVLFNTFATEDSLQVINIRKLCRRYCPRLLVLTLPIIIICAKEIIENVHLSKYLYENCLMFCIQNVQWFMRKRSFRQN